MHFTTVIGLVLGAGTIVTDRFIHKIPNWLAIALYGAAVALMIAGAILTRNQV